MFTIINLLFRLFLANLIVALTMLPGGRIREPEESELLLLVFLVLKSGDDATTTSGLLILADAGRGILDGLLVALSTAMGLVVVAVFDGTGRLLRSAEEMSCCCCWVFLAVALQHSDDAAILLNYKRNGR